MSKKRFVVRRRTPDTPASQDKYKERYYRELEKAKKKSMPSKVDTVRLEGKDFVNFAIDVNLWWEFVERFCQERTPNEVFTDMIQRVIDGRLEVD